MKMSLAITTNTTTTSHICEDTCHPLNEQALLQLLDVEILLRNSMEIIYCMSQIPPPKTSTMQINTPQPPTTLHRPTQGIVIASYVHCR